VGPLRTEGSSNRFDGNFWALVLPLCKRERLRLIGYLGECEFFPYLQGKGEGDADCGIDAFLHDDS
jgi:hypothetical protein